MCGRFCDIRDNYLVSATIPSVTAATAATPPATAPAVSQLSCVVPFMQVLVWTRRPSESYTGTHGDCVAHPASRVAKIPAIMILLMVFPSWCHSLQWQVE